MIEILVGDITQLQVTAIVNAANSSLLGGGGVDGAIHRAAGPELVEACRALRGCPTGEAKITPGFKLPAQYVIHTVGPVWHGGQHHEAALLEKCYRRCFDVAQQYSIRQIAFPCISTGAYGYPKIEAARIALAVMQQYAPEFERIMVACYHPQDAQIYQRLMAEHGTQA